MAKEENHNGQDQNNKENEESPEKKENQGKQENQNNNEKQKEQENRENQEGPEGQAEQGDQVDQGKRENQEAQEDQEDQGDHGDQVVQEKKMNLKNYLILLHISAIFLLLCLGILLTFYVLNSISKQDESTGSSEAKSPFFDSNTVYYVKSTLKDDLREGIIGLLKSLKMDRGSDSVKENANAGQKLIEKISISKEDDPQYFFYKADENTIYTFIKSRKKKKPAPERITISILEGKDPGNPPWGIYHLEKKLMGDSTDEYVYTLDYKKGRYDEEKQTPGYYKSLPQHLKDQNLENIVNLFAEGIQKTINGNPRSAKKNGENLDFRFSLSRKDENKRYIKVSGKRLKLPLVSTKRWVKARKPTENATHEEIDTFEIDDDRKNSLKEELMIALKDLFSTEAEKAIKSKLEIFKDGKNISKSSISSYSFVKVKALLRDNEHNSYQEWQSHFESDEIGIDCLDLIKYIDDKSEELREGGTGEKELSVSREAIFAIIAIIVVLILYVFFWCVIKLKIKKDAMGEGEDGEKKDADKEKGKKTKALEEYEIDMEKVGEEAGEAEPPGKDPLMRLTGIQKNKLEEIKDSLVKTGDKAIDIHTNKLDKKPGDNLDLKKLRAAEILIKGIVEDKNLKHQVFKLKLKKTQEILREFIKGNKITEIDKELEEIKKELDSFEIPGPPKEEPPTVDVVPHLTTKAIPDTKKILSDIQASKVKILNFLERLNKKYRQIFEAIKNSLKDEEKEKFDPDKYLVEVLTSIIENNQLLKEHKQLLENIAANITKINEDSRYEEKMHKMISYINKETCLLVSKDDVLDIIDKVIPEEEMSKEYRECAVNLYEDLSKLIKEKEKEKTYKDAWFWDLLADELLPKLKENIIFFRLKNEGAKTIYERHFGKEIPLHNINREDIKKVIEQHHWVQIWDVLIRMSDFFNVYFDDEMADLKGVLGYYSQKIMKILKKLGYEIKHIKPFSRIPNDYRKQHKIEPIDKSYIERFIIKNLAEEGNRKLRKAADNIPSGYERVIFVDRLGLVDKLAEKPVNITNLRFGSYNQGILQSYLSSWNKEKKRQEPDGTLDPSGFLPEDDEDV